MLVYRCNFWAIICTSWWKTKIVENRKIDWILEIYSRNFSSVYHRNRLILVNFGHNPGLNSPHIQEVDVVVSKFISMSSLYWYGETSYNKGDTLNCSNYLVIALLNTAHTQGICKCSVPASLSLCEQNNIQRKSSRKNWSVELTKIWDNILRL